MQTQKIKVRVVDLIVRIEAKKAEAKASYDEQIPAYEKAKEALLVSARAALLAASKAVLEGDLPSYSAAGGYRKGHYRKGVELTVKLPYEVQAPIEPESFDSDQYDRDIALLRMAADDTILVSPETDLGRRYL